jgi:hypothetical protein
MRVGSSYHVKRLSPLMSSLRTLPARYKPTAVSTRSANIGDNRPSRVMPAPNTMATGCSATSSKRVSTSRS